MVLLTGIERKKNDDNFFHLNSVLKFEIDNFKLQAMSEENHQCSTSDIVAYLKHVICSRVPMIRVMAASWALESDISSSYNEKACKGKRV